MGIADGVVPEPLGGAHREPETVAGEVGVRIATALDALSEEDSDELLERRYERLRAIGEYNETD